MFYYFLTTIRDRFDIAFVKVKCNLIHSIFLNDAKKGIQKWMVCYCGPPVHVMLEITSISRHLYTHAMATCFAFSVDTCTVAFSLSLDLVLCAGGMAVVCAFLALVFLFLAVDLAIRRWASSSLEGDGKEDMVDSHKWYFAAVSTLGNISDPARHHFAWKLKMPHGFAVDFTLDEKTYIYLNFWNHIWNWLWNWPILSTVNVPNN